MSSSKRQQTFAKRSRELAVKEKRARKLEKRQEKRDAARAAKEAEETASTDPDDDAE